jgi:hypothetical protein
MGAIVSAERRRARPTSARDGAAAAVETDRNRLMRPISAPPSLVLATERPVEVARRAHALQRVDDLQAGRTRAALDGGRRGTDVGGITPEQETLLELRIGEALVDQMLHEGQDLLSALPSPHTRILLQEMEASETPIAGVIRAVRDRVSLQSPAAAHGNEKLNLSLSRPRTATSEASSVDSDGEQERMRARFMRRCVVVSLVVSPPLH